MANNPVCSGGVCNLNCAPGWNNCDGNNANGCEDQTDYDSNNCGGCGPSFACILGWFCIQGTCNPPIQ